MISFYDADATCSQYRDEGETLGANGIAYKLRF